MGRPPSIPPDSTLVFDMEVLAIDQIKKGADKACAEEGEELKPGGPIHTKASPKRSKVVCEFFRGLQRKTREQRVNDKRGKEGYQTRPVYRKQLKKCQGLFVGGYYAGQSGRQAEDLVCADRQCNFLDKTNNAPLFFALSLSLVRALRFYCFNARQVPQLKDVNGADGTVKR